MGDKVITEIIVKYHNKPHNWGDAIGPVIVEKIAKQKIKKVNISYKNSKKEDVYLTVGSILQRADQYSIIWGSGFISKGSVLKETPKTIHAIRGPLTGKKLESYGLKCEVFGDPVLLYPRFYTPNKIQKKYKLGIIPHFMDKNSLLINRFKNIPEVLIIDIQGTINGFVDDICKCELIASSSLHGVIAADAYNIPSVWVQLSSAVKGDGFKFRDYFLSVNRKDTDPLIFKKKTTIQQIYDKFYNYEIDIDLDKLYDVCPFKKENLEKLL